MHLTVHDSPLVQAGEAPRDPAAEREQAGGRSLASQLIRRPAERDSRHPTRGTPAPFARAAAAEGARRPGGVGVDRSEHSLLVLDELLPDVRERELERRE